MRSRNAAEERDMGWLHEKLRGRSFAAIADDGGDRDRDRAVVQRAVDRLADAAGVDRTGW